MSIACCANLTAIIITTALEGINIERHNPSPRRQSRDTARQVDYAEGFDPRD